MDFISVRDMYDIVKYLTRKDLFGLYELAFNETLKEFPIIEKKKGELSQINEKYREIIEDFERYKDLDNLKDEICTIYHKELNREIPQDILSEFMDSLFKNFREKIFSHPEIRERLDSSRLETIYRNTEETNRLVRESYQCRSPGTIQTPEGMCRIDWITEGFIAKVRLILGTHQEILGRMNSDKIINLVEKMEGDPEYVGKNPERAVEVFRILFESFHLLPPDAKDARILYCTLLAKLAGEFEFLQKCELPSNYDELNFQAYITSAMITLNRGDVKTAREYFEKLAKYGKVKERIQTAILEGRILIEEYQRDKAISQFENVLDDADSYERKIILFYLGVACYQRSFLQKALMYWKKLEEIEDDKGKKIAIIGNFGVIYHIKGELDEALKYFEDALKIDREIGYKQGEAYVLGNIGLVYREKGELDEALKYFEDALKIDREIGYRQGEASDLGNIGLVYREKGELDEALRYQKSALEIDREIGYRQGEASDLGNIGVIYHIKGELDEALRYQKSALEIDREIGYRQGEANDLGNIGVIYRIKGELDEALKYFEDALKIDRDIGYRHGEASDLGNIGLVYSNKGELDEALRYQKSALEIDREIGYRQGEANDLGNIGVVYINKGELDETLKYFEDALKIFREIGYRQGEASDLGNIGLVYREKGELDEALKYFEDALKIDREIGYRKGEANDLGNIGIILKLCRKETEALTYLNESLKIFDEIGLPKEAEIINYHILQICLK